MCSVGHPQPAADVASMGFLQLPQSDGHSTTVFYPASGAEVPVSRGPFNLSWVPDGAPLKGNGRLVVISHGSGGSPWVHVDLARALVRRGFTVAVPLHQGDNYLDPSEPGPVSWRKRPLEISQAIDRVGRYAALGNQLSLDSVGVFGGSAGGHTALSLAGGQWSDERFKAHCNRNIEEDFSSCVGFITLLKGNALDPLKLWAARRVIDWRFSDATVHHYHDPRITSTVAMVPFAADFILESLARPAVKLGLVIARKDVNQVPRFHVESVAKTCIPRCELVMDLPEGGHGAMLSPMPPLERGSVGERLLADPPSFNREQAIADLNVRLADFFVRHLTTQP
ncbi:dienelactone hydrolase [Caenimonas sedimenti]|uniref:Dienelactone hydrolase n=1 Tax=Caenimonas sedimenti TaxID=2596921 RepID=A0A562ZPA8_9BURK|nr:dienelactone hydrolase [Caenimonas sedimenti]